MSKKENQKSESWYDWDVYDGLEIKDVNIWDNRLRINPIHGMEIQNRDDLMSFLIFLEDGNPFEYTDGYDIYNTF